LLALFIEPKVSATVKLLLRRTIQQSIQHSAVDTYHIKFKTIKTNDTITAL
jgi:hypothetical protein